MSQTFQQYNVSPWLTPVRVVNTSNLAGTYYNGSNNNGVGATFTIAATSLTIDSVVLHVGDRLLLVAQTLENQNGIYVVNIIGSTVVLQRSADMQSIEQLQAGFYVSVAAGTSNGGDIYCLIEPLPGHFGIDNLHFAEPDGVDALTPTVIDDLASFSNVLGDIKDSGISAASVAALLAGSGSPGSPSNVRSASVAGTFPTATTVIADPAITAASVVIAAFVSSANVVSIQTVLPAAGQFTINTDTAPSTGVLEYISFIPSAALVTAGVVAGKTSFSSGPATFVMSAPGITPGMVVVANFESQGTPSRIYTALPGTDQITFVVSAGPGVSVMDWVGMLPGDIAPLGLHAADYSYAGGSASVAISDASITASSIVVANFKSEAGANYIQKVTPSAGTLTVLVNADPGVSVFAYVATAAAGGGSSGNSSTPQVTSLSTSSATPGTVRAITGKNADVATTMTSGNLVGVRGEVDMVGASGGFIYGVQGKVIPTGTLSGSVWAPAVFGQYDLSNATLNAGQIAAFWGDMGASGGTFTDVTGARMFAGTNTIASLTLNSMIYLDGKATSLLELNGGTSTYISAGAATPSGDLKKLAITIDGVVHYILAAAVWS